MDFALRMMAGAGRGVPPATVTADYLSSSDAPRLDVDEQTVARLLGALLA